MIDETTTGRVGGGLTPSVLVVVISFKTSDDPYGITRKSFDKCRATHVGVRRLSITWFQNKCAGVSFDIDTEVRSVQQIASPSKTRTGSMNVDASTRVTTRYLNGFVHSYRIDLFPSLIESQLGADAAPDFPQRWARWWWRAYFPDDRNTYDRGQLRFHPIINHRWPQLHGQYQAHDGCCPTSGNDL